jgi:hypothetical protein
MFVLEIDFCSKREKITFKINFIWIIVKNIQKRRSISYIKPINISSEGRYYGVFHSLRDAIKIVSENDFVKVGEITS